MLPKATGRDALIEKKKAVNESNRAIREAKDDTFGEVKDSVLMGAGDDDFRAM